MITWEKMCECVRIPNFAYKMIIFTCEIFQFHIKNLTCETTNIAPILPV